MTEVPTPKDRFSSLDTLALVRELRALERARVDKAFDLVPVGWSLVFRVPGTGRRELVLVPGRYAALVETGPEHREELSPFARELRRLLTGAMLGTVAEPGGERLLELRLSRSDEPNDLLLALEMFGTGNLLIAREGKIVAVAHPRTWAHRSVRVGAEYQRPPGRSDPWLLTPDQIESELGHSRTDLASTLAARLGLGGPVAEELIARGGWGPKEAATKDPHRVGRRLHALLHELWQEVGARPSGLLYELDGVPVDATPYRSHRWERIAGVVSISAPTFSVTAHRYFSTTLPERRSREEAEATRLRQEIERLILQQRRAVESLTDSADRLRAQAEAILAHYPEVDRALTEARDQTDAPARIELTLDQMRVPLLTRRSPRESAQALFDEAKRLGNKLVGARAALEDSERRLPSITPSLPRSSPDRPESGPRRVHWFERYRWFITSEGAIVIAGRDAASNDQVVKRHLKEGDIYVHADLHGAASVVVKHPPAGAQVVTEISYREAGQWAVAYSKAWRAGLASASAFWVAHDQVSKAGESGEFVARGAWVVRGSKNLMRDLPTEVALGTIDYEGETRWTTAPPSALLRRGVVRVLLTPGEERMRAEREAELSRELGVGRGVLQSLLPAGGLTVRRP